MAKYPQVRLISQSQAGLAAARNTGLAAVSSRFVIFLDADDALAPNAIAAGLACMAANPGCGMVYGAHTRTDASLDPVEENRFSSLEGEPWHALLRGNPIGMHATVFYDRECLESIGGFDPALRKCEDYDCYLRMARAHPVAAHRDTVALYRIHGSNMSGDPVAMLDAALEVLERNRPEPGDAAALAAWEDGRRRWRLVYAHAAWNKPGVGWKDRLAMTRRHGRSSLAGAAWGAVRPLLPESLRLRLKGLAGFRPPAPGTIDFGDLGRVTPVSAIFGFDRGTPVDRWYIERFLQRHAGDIRGRVLEVGDADYSERFGNGVTRQDVLHVEPGNSAATIVGDLSDPDVLPPGAFDCLVLTQTLQYVSDFRAAAMHMHRALAPGGVLLLTVPGVSSIDRGEWRDRWLWSFTEKALRLVFEPVFGPANLEIEAVGNVHAATCFLQGLAVEEVDEGKLAHHDPAFPLVVTLRARRAG